MGGSKGSSSYSGMLFAHSVEDNSTSPVNCLPLYCHWSCNKSCVLCRLRRLPSPTPSLDKAGMPCYQRWPFMQDPDADFGPIQPSRMKGQRTSAWVALG